MISLAHGFLIVYGVYWSCLLVGVMVVRSCTRIGRRLEVYTWNSRIRAWHALPQFRHLFGAMQEKRYLTASLLVMAFNLPMVVMQYVVGLVLLSPLLAAGTGGLAGLIVGQGKGRGFFLYAAATAVFEFGAFAAAGALGMMVGVSWLLQGISFVESVAIVTTRTGPYVLLPVACLIANGLVEAAGPCFRDIDGVPGIEAYRNRTMKQVKE